MQRFNTASFNSYLPKILGSKIMNLFDLFPRPLEEYFTGFDDRVIPTSRNGFMAGAFRFGHSMVKDHLAFKDCSGNEERTLFRYIINCTKQMQLKKYITWASGRTFIECRQVIKR